MGRLVKAEVDKSDALMNALDYQRPGLFERLFRQFMDEDPTFQDRFFNSDDFKSVQDRLLEPAFSSAEWLEVLESVGEYDADW